MDDGSFTGDRTGKKIRVVLSVVAGEVSVTAAARKEQVFEQSI